jgi:hypothetical protein
MAALRNKSAGSIDDFCIPLDGSDQWGPRQFSAGKLLLLKCSWIKTSFLVKGKNVECDPSHPDWLSVDKLNDCVGHPYSLPGEKREAVAFCVLEHLRKLRVGETIETIVLIEQKHPAGKTHHAARPLVVSLDPLRSAFAPEQSRCHLQQ